MKTFTIKLTRAQAEAVNWVMGWGFNEASTYINEGAGPGDIPDKAKYRRDLKRVGKVIFNLTMDLAK